MPYVRKNIIPRHLTLKQIRDVYNSARWPEAFFRSIKNRYNKIDGKLFLNKRSGAQAVIVRIDKIYYNLDAMHEVSYYKLRKYYDAM